MQAKRRKPVSTIVARRILVYAAWCCVSSSACVDAGSRGQEAASRPSEVFHLQSDLRIYGTPTTPFGIVAAVATDMLGRFYVLDGMLQMVHVFDANGAYVNSLGRRGSGPGEFNGAMDIAVSPDSLVWVTDGMAGKHVVFDLDGNVVRTIPRVEYRGASYLGDRPFDMDGNYVDWALGFPNETGISPSDIIEAYPVVVGEVAETDTMPPVKFWPDIVNMSSGRRPAVFFAPTLLIAMDGRGSIWFSDSREYRVVRRSLAGDTIGELRLREEAALVSDEDRSEIRKRARGRASMLEYIDVLPDRKPIIVGIFPDGAGRVVVIPETTTARRGEAVDLFGEDGQYLGRMRVPDPVDLLPGRVAMHATREFLYVGGTDETGTPVLLRLRVVASK